MDFFFGTIALIGARVILNCFESTKLNGNTKQVSTTQRTEKLNNLNAKCKNSSLINISSMNNGSLKEKIETNCLRRNGFELRKSKSWNIIFKLKIKSTDECDVHCIMQRKCMQTHAVPTYLEEIYSMAVSFEVTIRMVKYVR